MAISAQGRIPPLTPHTSSSISPRRERPLCAPFLLVRLRLLRRVPPLHSPPPAPPSFQPSSPQWPPQKIVPSVSHLIPLPCPSYYVLECSHDEDLAASHIRSVGVRPWSKESSYNMLEMRGAIRCKNRFFRAFKASLAPAPICILICTRQ